MEMEHRGKLYLGQVYTRLVIKLNVQMPGTSIWDLHQFKFSATEMLNRKNTESKDLFVFEPFSTFLFFVAIEPFIVLVVAIKTWQNKAKTKVFDSCWFSASPSASC